MINRRGIDRPSHPSLVTSRPARGSSSIHFRYHRRMRDAPTIERDTRGFRQPQRGYLNDCIVGFNCLPLLLPPPPPARMSRLLRSLLPEWAQSCSLIRDRAYYAISIRERCDKRSSTGSAINHDARGPARRFRTRGELTKRGP